MSEPYEYLDIKQTFFAWPRADHGYYWDSEARPIDRDGKVEERPIKSFLIETPDSTCFNFTNHMEDEPVLFFKFAGVEPTYKDILAFANTYGTLTIGEMLITPIYSYPKDRSVEKPWRHGVGFIVDIGDGNEYAQVAGDSFGFWVNEIRDMRWTIQLWEWVRDEDIPSLERVIEWSKDNDAVNFILANKDILLRYSTAKEAKENLRARQVQSANEDNSYLLGTLASKYGRPETFQLFRSGDILLPARCLLQLRINKKLEDYPVGLKLLRNDKNKLEPYIYPSSLLSALWLQLFQAVTGERKYKRCIECGKWEDVTQRNKNWSKHSDCANRARVKKHREGGSNG